MKSLITGISGFAGTFLAEHLVSKNFEVLGVYLQEASLTNLGKTKDKVSLFKLDLSDKDSVFDFIKQNKPDYIFHLAALTSPSDSFDDPFTTIQNNINAQLNILEALRKLSFFDTKILVVSSAEIYGLIDKKDLPIDENVSFKPTNPYAVSKITQDFLGLQYFLSYNLKVIRVRPFNHIGPRQGDKFVVSAFARKIAEIEKGKREPVLTVGNLKSKRDFTDVRDMVKAYLLSLEKGTSGDVYNLGSGRSYEISEVLDKLLSLSSAKIQVKEDKSLLRPVDNPESVCNYDKFFKITGWKPEISLDQTLRDTLDYWRNII
ncbi:MAG: GDP-mannose 4,6-dehydratase [Patescibacteria group bacterium]